MSKSAMLKSILVLISLLFVINKDEDEDEEEVALRL